jgi:starch phosphorylase
MEFGLHECLPIYSGGLGVLAGDHLKSASDLGVPLVAIGLLYRQGYFRQRLTNDGWQLEEYPTLDFYEMPITRVSAQNGDELNVEVRIGPRNVRLAVWLIQVGRVPLYMLDADLPENDPADREVTARLYQGGEEDRIRQEIALGIGGVRVLKALNIHPDVCHMNEGHSAFLSLERLRQCMEEEGLDLRAAREATVPGHVFTTHTPVPAGIDRFSDDLVKRYLTEPGHLVGLSVDAIRSLGTTRSHDAAENFNMAVFGLRLAGDANGVSKLHGEVSRTMWQHVWPGAPLDEVPIKSVTNGIHITTWLSSEMAVLFERYLGPSWADNPVDYAVWDRVMEIPDMELWRTKVRRRERLISFARRRLREQLRHRGAPVSELKAADEILDPEALTIGFARRFAPYKRAALILRDTKRLLSILSHPDRPVQILFAGKAHPRDELGKELIKQILTAARNPEFRRRLVFIEDYDINVARQLVQGCDVWLNNPFRPREASGTSGMKVVPNGGINLSALDGWWPEAYDGENGWAIGDGRVYQDPGYQDYLESEAIYDLLEKEIVPLFYERSADGVPQRWAARMKNSMRTICPVFNTNRMVEEYTERHYVVAARRARHMRKNKFAAARSLSAWKARINGCWSQVRIESVETDGQAELPVGAEFALRTTVHLGEVDPKDVATEVYFGPIDANGRIDHGRSIELNHTEGQGNGAHRYVGRVPCERSGQHGYAVRVVPRHADLLHRYDTGLIVWG